MSATRSQMLPAVILQGLEKILNLLVSSDAFGQQRFDQLANKSLRFQIKQPAMDFYLQIYTGQLRLTVYQNQAPDVTVKGPGMTFIQQFFQGKTAGSLVAGDIVIEGDQLLLQQSSEIFRELQPQLELPLAELFGDDIAFHAGQAVRDGSQLLKSAGRKLLNNSQQAIDQGQTPLLSRGEFDGFRNDVKKLRQQTEQLISRATLLENTLAKD